ncbi:PPOX class F420-dependent oxidoreductase [Actinosynnema sp. NPDC020468]|uniref:PPOX class F420-dependent oxidoreductase n=1 Tax=Actinosynnema sp. NPDC020468 TaxID=3154488 RepID=UPI0033CA8C77
MTLGQEKYVVLTTFRRSGQGVPTPVWAAEEGGALYVWSARDAGKVKRIRNGGAVTVGPCDFRGNPTGPAVDATAEVLGAEESAHAKRLIARKYGLVGRLTLFGSRIRRGEQGTVGIRVVPTTSA